jgi:hypothetical protein
MTHLSKGGNLVQVIRPEDPEYSYNWLQFVHVVAVVASSYSVVAVTV